MNLENPKYRGILQLNFEVVQITTWFQGWQHFHKSCWVTSTWGMRYLSIDERPWGTVELVNIMHHGYPHRYLERMTKKRVRGLLWDQQILARFFGALVFKTWFCITWFWPWMCWCVFFQPYFLFVQVSSQATCVLLFHLFLVDPNFALAWQAWHGNSSLGCILRDLRGRFQKLLPPEFAHYSDRDFMHAVAWQLI